MMASIILQREKNTSQQNRQQQWLWLTYLEYVYMNLSIYLVSARLLGAKLRSDKFDKGLCFVSCSQLLMKV